MPDGSDQRPRAGQRGGAWPDNSRDIAERLARIEIRMDNVAGSEKRILDAFRDTRQDLRSETQKLSGYVDARLGEIRQTLEKDYVRQSDYKFVRQAVLGAITMIVIGFLAALVALVMGNQS